MRINRWLTTVRAFRSYTHTVPTYQTIVAHGDSQTRKVRTKCLHTTERVYVQVFSNRLVPDSVIVLRLPAVSLESSRHSFAYLGAKLRNVVPASIRHSLSLQLFSKLYLDYLKMRLPDVSTDRYDILDFV